MITVFSSSNTNTRLLQKHLQQAAAVLDRDSGSCSQLLQGINCVNALLYCAEVSLNR